MPATPQIRGDLAFTDLWANTEHNLEGKGHSPSHSVICPLNLRGRLNFTLFLGTWVHASIHSYEIGARDIRDHLTWIAHFLNENRSICPRLMSSSREGNGTPLQYSCLENPRDGGAWWAAIYGVAQSDMTEAT